MMQNKGNFISCELRILLFIIVLKKLVPLDYSSNNFTLEF